MGTDEVQALLKIVNVFMQVQNNPKALISKNQEKMTSHTKQAMYKMCLLEKNGVLEGLKWTNLIYISTWIWSPYNQVLGSLLPLYCFKHTHTPQQRVKNTAGPQSHISSGSSWGLRMPGTDICSLCFSSWARRRDASLSSRNRSLVSSPANS